MNVTLRPEDNDKLFLAKTDANLPAIVMSGLQIRLARFPVLIVDELPAPSEEQEAALEALDALSRRIEELREGLQNLLVFAEEGAEALDERERRREPQWSYSFLDASSLEHARSLLHPEPQETK